MNLTLDDQALAEANLDDNALRLELAIALYQGNKLTLGQASRLAELPRMIFQRELGSRGEAINYDEEEFLKDIKNINSF